jgi:hypothetical protein
MPATATAISAKQANELWASGRRVVFVDARNPEAWGSSSEKLPGAIRMRPDDVDQHLREIPSDATVIAYCT